MTADTLPRTIEYARDARGALFAIERVRAEAWDVSYLEPPAREIADARVLELGVSVELEGLPGWLRIETLEEASLRVAEAAPAYAVSQSSTVAGLWDASPYFSHTSTSVDEFVRAAASAILAPAAAPGEAGRGALTVRRYAATSALLAPFIDLEGDARERWLQRTFADGEALAYEVLLERIAADAPEAASTLRFLRDAEIAENAAEYLDLAFDRQALLEQASPWRYYESSDDFAPALAAVRAWIRRYRGAYELHYGAAVRAAQQMQHEPETLDVAAEALRQLNAIGGLGHATGVIALHAFARARSAVDALPASPDPELARTATVVLGAPVAAIDDARRAAKGIHAALEVQRRRLAQRTAHLVLDREEVPALDRLLQALAAADVDGLERILDARLTAHIEQLIA